MFFYSMEDLNLWLVKNQMFNFASGEQGKCYKIGEKVYKVFMQFIEEDDLEKTIYHREDILRFSHLTNNLYIFPKDVIMVGELVVGYITDYVDAMSLYKISPLNVDLDCFEKALDKTTNDIKFISDNGVLTFDVMYNILYGNCGLRVIDSMEYSSTDIDSKRLFRMNQEKFNHEIRLFLIDGYFDEFIMNDALLYSVYYDPDVNFVDFFQMFRKKLSENNGYEIKKLIEAKSSMSVKKREKVKYIRELYI